MSSNGDNDHPSKELPTVKTSVDDGASDVVDTAWKFLNVHQDAQDSADITALRRKIDWHIVPLMFLCYTMQFLDKVIINVSLSPSCPHVLPSESRI